MYTCTLANGNALGEMPNDAVFHKEKSIEFYLEITICDSSQYN